MHLGVVIIYRRCFNKHEKKKKSPVHGTVPIPFSFFSSAILFLPVEKLFDVISRLNGYDKRERSKRIPIKLEYFRDGKFQLVYIFPPLNYSQTIEHSYIVAR
ncbi:hypothetical protein PUN28_013222 [Cardiocondyla obscurior]|uniref:Uncharacterized protein n=1 Tax=Cardiocondyla obscurior TaxID=286306 RepID=A0AAW2FCI4_9HYME